MPRSIPDAPSRRAIGFVRAAALTLLLAGCAGAKWTEPLPEEAAEIRMTQATAAAFSNPEPVNIVGYGQDAMEPFLTRDGTTLFFNSSNAPGADTNLFWASRIDDVTFRFRGEIAGANSAALDAVASMDLAGNFYFISTRSYDATLSTIYCGRYSNGSLSAVAIAPGVSPLRRGLVDFDSEISADGNTLYFSEGLFTGGSIPRSSRLMIAHRDGDRFVRAADSDRILAEVNGAGRLNYAAALSPDELEIFFTRLGAGEPEILMARRASRHQPFGAPARIAAITGFVEAPATSPDGRSLYFHKRNDNGVYSIYRSARP